MTKFTHSKFFSFIKKNWFLALVIIVLTMNVISSIYSLCQFPESLKINNELRNSLPDMPQDLINDAIIALDDSKRIIVMQIILESIKLALNVGLVVLTCIWQLQQKTNLKNVFLIISTIVLVFNSALMTYYFCLCVNSLNQCYHASLSQSYYAPYIWRIIINAIGVLLNIGIMVMIYIRRFYHKREQPTVAD